MTRTIFTTNMGLIEPITVPRAQIPPCNKCLSERVRNTLLARLEVGGNLKQLADAAIDEVCKNIELGNEETTDPRIINALKVRSSRGVKC